MLHTGRLGALSLVLMILLLTGSSASGQTADAKLDRPNLEIQMHLLATSDTADRTMPPALEPVLKQLKSSLPPANYHLAATFTNRIRSGGTLEVKGVLASELISPLTNNTGVYDFTLSQVRVAADDRQFFEVPRLKFNFQVPIIVGMTRADANSPATPSINYSNVGLSTEVSVKEGSPTVVGTMTTSKPSQLLVLVLTIKRTQ